MSVGASIELLDTTGASSSATWQPLRRSRIASWPTLRFVQSPRMKRSLVERLRPPFRNYGPNVLSCGRPHCWEGGEEVMQGRASAGD